jgi:hypothetical protein
MLNLVKKGWIETNPALNAPKHCLLVLLAEARLRKGKAFGSDDEKTGHGMFCGHSAEKEL